MLHIFNKLREDMFRTSLETKTKAQAKKDVLVFVGRSFFVVVV